MYNSNTILLYRLLSADNRFVSGSTLATEMGISRAGLKKRVDKLKSSGFTIEAVRNRGYRLVQVPPRPHSALIEAYLRLQGILQAVDLFHTLDSTQLKAKEYFSQTLSTPFIIIARQQTAGYGRRGRPWYSIPDTGCYASFGFRPNRPPQHMQAFTQWIAIQLCVMLSTVYGIPAQIKWPNDILIHGRKLAGLLTETQIDSEVIRDLVLGLGVNINTTTWPDDIATNGISLREATGEEIDINACIAKISATVITAYHCFVQGRCAQSLLHDWHQYDALAGKRVNVQSFNESYIGKSLGINNAGQLCIRTDSGNDITVSAADVSLAKTS